MGKPGDQPTSSPILHASKALDVSPSLSNIPTLSNRGQRQLLSVGPGTLFAQETRSGSYDPLSDPEGSINFGIAENGLMTDELSEFYQNQFRLSPKDYVYSDTISATTRLLTSTCNFLNTHFDPHPSIALAHTITSTSIPIPLALSRDNSPNNTGPVHPTHLIGGAGAGVLICQFAYAVMNPGDGMLVVEPYYGSFDRDVKLMNDVKIIGVDLAPPVLCTGKEGIYELEESMTLREVDRLDEVLKKNEEEGTKIKAVILCNPHNPIGRSYPRSVLIAYAQFCERYNIHLLSDELYAYSYYTSQDYPSIPPEGKFHSMLSFDWRKDHGVNPARIHVLYGMSKDFHSNGFRVAVLISPFNPDLIISLRTTSPFMMISTPADLLFSAVLNDSRFLENFLKEMQRRSGEAYDFLASWLKWHGVRYIPAYVGQFILVNLRPFLSDEAPNKALLTELEIEKGMSMIEREMALVLYGVRKYKLHLASGTGFHMSEGGWVRFTFTMEREKCIVGLRRIEKMMRWKKSPLPTLDLKNDKPGKFVPAHLG